MIRIGMLIIVLVSTLAAWSAAFGADQVQDRDRQYATDPAHDQVPDQDRIRDRDKLSTTDLKATADRDQLRDRTRDRDPLRTHIGSGQQGSGRR